MKKLVFLFCIFLVTPLLYSQSWQWGKRGGSEDNLNTNGDNRPEEVYRIVTDSQNNIYVLSPVGRIGLDVDGVTKTNYGDFNQITDIMLASFSCDGSYRWSKVIGGLYYDKVNDLQIDNQDNIYIAGKFGGCGNASYPPRIDNDVIISQSPLDCSVIFIAKFNSSGVMQWFKRPQPSGTSQSVGTNNTFSKGFSMDAVGNCYWLVQIPPGVYADGAFTNIQTGNNFYIFKYDSNGNFLSALPIDMQISTGFNTTLQFNRNQYNGYFYFTSVKFSSTNTAVVGGQTITHTAFLACFNELGQFQWVREDTGTTSYLGIEFYNLDFDTQNNIYIGGKITGTNYTSFLGLIVPEPIVTGFVMKVNPDATTKLWSTYYNLNGALQRGAIKFNNNEVGFAGLCFGTNFTWGTQTLNASGTNQGTEALLARFNKDTGACISLSKIPGNAGYDDYGTALAVDSSGDYIYGGGCGNQLTFTTNSITATGAQSDFFLAKYSTSVCSLNNDEYNLQGLQMAPNPTSNNVTISTYEPLSYSIFNLTGSLVANGTITEQNNTIDVSNLSSGCYLVQTITVDGLIKRAKLLKQ